MKQKANLLAEMLAVLLWGALTGMRLFAAWQNAHVIPVLLAAQFGLAAWLLITRRRQAVEGRWLHKLVAWLSALLPLALQIRQETWYGQALTAMGLLLMLWALGALGRSFGVAPADRGLVKGGPYRLIRHPMYLGELVALAGAVLGSPSLWNSLALHGLLLTLLLRMRWEEQCIFGYSTYGGRVRWRLMPGIW